MVKIKIKRESRLINMAATYKVFLNGNFIGGIKNGKEIDFDIPEGNHEIFLKTGWCRSNKVSFKANGRNVSFETGCNVKGWKLLISNIYAIFYRNNYLWLKEVQ